jgi:peptide/nickel transport system permease protein
MAAFLTRRFAEAIPVVVLATMVIFLGMRLIPGDPALVLAGQDAVRDLAQQRDPR